MEVDEKVLPSIGSEVLKAIVEESNANQLPTKRFRVSALHRSGLDQGAFSATHPQRRAPLRWPRFSRPRHAPLSDSSLRRALDCIFHDMVYNLAAQSPVAHPGPFQSTRLTCNMDAYQAGFARWLRLLIDKGGVRGALPDFLTAAAAGWDPLRVVFVDAIPSLCCIVTTVAGVNRIHLTLCARRSIVAAAVGEIFFVDNTDIAIELLSDKLCRITVANCVCVGLWLAQGNTTEGSDPAGYTATVGARGGG